MKSLVSFLTLALLTTAGFAGDKQITISAGEKPTMKLKVPDDAEVTASGDKTSIRAKDLRIYVWNIPKAKTIAEAIPTVSEVIKSEFIKFVVEKSGNVVVAQKEGKHLKGRGEEADDNDPGTADVVIFTVGENVFAACVHGEKDEAEKERPAFLKVLESIEAP